MQPRAALVTAGVLVARQAAGQVESHPQAVGARLHLVHSLPLAHRLPAAGDKLALLVPLSTLVPFGPVSEVHSVIVPGKEGNK